jgi:hypothetical protein
MPKTSISSPSAAGAVDRLTLLTAEARADGVDVASTYGTAAAGNLTCMAEE